MLCDPGPGSAEGAPMDNQPLQPWQIYSGLFLGFWAVTAYCDHFLATSLLCLVFGCAGDQLTRYMFTLSSSGGKEEEAPCLLAMARQEASLVPSLTIMAKQERSGKALLNEEFKEEDEEEEEEGPPPPVPARKDDIAERLDGVSEKLQMLSRDGPTEL